MASDDPGLPPLTVDAPAGPDASGADAPPSAVSLSPIERDLVIRTVASEAGDPDGWGGVANVIRNRMTAGTNGGFPTSASGVVLQPRQFEVWQDGSAAKVNPSSAAYARAARVVDGVFSGALPDNTSGSTHFLSPSGQIARAGDGRTLVPSWATNPKASIGGNVFFAPNGVVSRSGGLQPSGDGDLSDDDLMGMLTGRGGAPTAATPPGQDAPPPGSAAPPPTSPGQAPQGIGASPAATSRASQPGPTSGAITADPGPSDDELLGLLTGAGGSGEDLSDDALLGMLTGRSPGPGAPGGPGALTIHGSAPAAGVTPTAQLAAAMADPSGQPAPIQGAPSAGKGPAPLLPASVDDFGRPVGTPEANAALEGDRSLFDLPEVGANMAREAGEGVPYLRGAVNPLAAGLATLVDGHSYSDNAAVGNALGAKFEAEHPWLTGASRLAGGAAVFGPLAEAAPAAFGLQKAAPLWARMMTGGSANALLAYTDAKVNGEDPLGGGYIGNGLRYGLGFAAPAAGDIAGGVTRLGGKLGGWAYDRAANLLTGSHAWSGVGGYGSAAVDYLLNKIAADGGVGAAADKLGQLGPEGMIADTGPSLRSETANLATTPGEMKSTVESAIAARHDGRTSRILSDVDAALGPAQSPTPWRHAVADAGAAVTEPYFARAYAAGAPWTPELDALSQRPAVRNALTEAATDAANRGAPLPSVTLDAAGNPVAAGAPLAAYEAGQRPAVTAALADALGVDPTAGPLAIGDRIAANRSAAADPAYQAYRSMPAVSTSPELAELLSRPSGRAAVAAAERKAADQGGSIYVPRPELEPAPTGGGQGVGGTDIPDATEGLGPGPGAVMGPGSSARAEGAPSPSWSGSLGSGAPQRPTGPAPVSLVSFLQRGGGIDPAGGDALSMDLDRFPGLIRRGGMSLDAAREAAAEAGYLGGDTARAVHETTPNDLLDALGNHPTYSVHDEDAAAARRAWADYQASRGGPTAHDLAAEAVRSHLLENDVPAGSIDPDTLDLAAHFHARGMDPGDAWEAAATADPFPGDLPAEPRAAGGGAPAEPATPPPRDLTPEGLDYVHRALGDRIASALRGSDPRPDDARIFGGLQDELRAAMENHPNQDVGAAYAAARRAYAGPSRELEALDLGRRAYGNTVTREQVARDFAGLRTDGERQQFRQGLFSAAAEKLAQKSDGANFVDALAGNQAFRDKLATVAASPEALGRFGAALDTARQTFTEATRPGVQALHGALDTLDARVARGAGDGVEASRNALVDILNRDPDFARGRELQGSYNALTGAFDDGDRALQSGPNAVHPDDFAERFAARTPAGQEAERIAMRNQVDRALGSKPNDLLALRSTLQGEQGWNGRKIASAFGEDAGNALANTVGREETFSATHGKVVGGPKSTEMLKGSAAREASARGAVNLLNATGPGMVAQPLKSMVYDKLVHALFDASNEPRDLEVARMLVDRGASRDEIVAQMARLEARRAAVKGGVNALASAVRTGGNLLTNAGAPIAAAHALGTDAGREADQRMRRAAAYGQGMGNALLGDSIVPPPRNLLLGK